LELLNILGHPVMLPLPEVMGEQPESLAHQAPEAMVELWPEAMVVQVWPVARVELVALVMPEDLLEPI